MEQLLTLYSEVQSTDVRWLWYPFIAIGKITLLQGDPGDGKSTIFELDESQTLIGKNHYKKAENSAMNLGCRLYRSKWIQSIMNSDVMEYGLVVENPMIGAIPSKNEVQRELDALLMSM